MKQLSKLLLKIFLALIGLFLIASILVSVFVDINHYKNDIINLVETKMGLQLEINGDLNLSILSGIKFNSTNIKLSHDKYLIADIEEVNLGVTLNSLFLDEPEVSSLELNVRELNIGRDKKGHFIFLPEIDTMSNMNDKNLDETGALYFKNLTINNIKLEINRFSYLDDLGSQSIRLNKVNASLSLLPVIDHHELVIDDPRVLTDYSYSGNLALEQAIVNQYQIANLSLNFKAQKGDIFADELQFSFIQEGEDHKLPPLVFDSHGKLKLKLAYSIPDGASEPDWSQPEMITIEKFDINFPDFKLSNDEFQLDAKQSHLVFDEFSIFEGSQYTLNDLFIHSLTLDSNQVAFTMKEPDKYHLNKVRLQLNDFPLIQKKEFFNLTSDLFLRQLAQKGRVSLSSDRFSGNHEAKQSQGLNNVKVLVEAKDNTINLSTLSFNAMESELSGRGQLSFQKKIPQWNFSLDSDKLNLQPVANVLNAPSNVMGHASIHNQFSGVLQNSDFKVSQGKVQVKAKALEVTGMDLDKVLEDFQSSQSVGLLDVGAVVLLGPAGVLVTKGNDYHNLVSSWKNKGTSKISQLNSDISFDNNIATMNDVAFATKKHRLAVQGKINIQNRRFIDFEVATIDKQGCPVYKEAVKGSLDSPSVKKANVLVSSVVNPVSSLISKVTTSLNIHCKEPFYKGVVRAPVR